MHAMVSGRKVMRAEAVPRTGPGEAAANQASNRRPAQKTRSAIRSGAAAEYYPGVSIGLRWFDTRFELAEAKPKRFVLADVLHIGPGGDLVLQADSPITGIDQEAPQTFAL